MARRYLDYAAVDLRAGGDHHLAAFDHVGGHHGSEGFALPGGNRRKPLHQPDADVGSLAEFAGSQRARMHNVAVRVIGGGVLRHGGLSRRAGRDMHDSAVIAGVGRIGRPIGGRGLRLSLRLGWRGEGRLSVMPGRGLGLRCAAGSDLVIRRGIRSSLVGVGLARLARLLRCQSGSCGYKQGAYKNRPFHPSLLLGGAPLPRPLWRERKSSLISKNPGGAGELRAKLAAGRRRCQLTQAKANADCNGNSRHRRGQVPCTARIKLGTPQAGPAPFGPGLHRYMVDPGPPDSYR